ncbi:flagellar biosynthesis protein FliQ [Rickettsiales endosymbiont of Stachyamoeba lipophora]|uniref:flagellar biosynthesis protein FliQ n=1 Tax=Rickettsiales endosymbiont of Stachyamoeba lipophora TaxID=2486578 RepID=UPI000F6558D9|nr:flagellar biosynthesis protein FliQ [Rickettsiales endosymbiont of Stachyamoeba lipophora]AZL15300.1 flagellar biosynthetic protein FliQ [Rickettsiales endosymbiont of Stachyamoeba lipophora]
MDSNEVLYIATEAIYVFLKAAAPLLIIALVIGLTISLLQALTQIQEATIAFVPKLFAVLLSLIFLLPFIGNGIGSFSMRIAEKIAGL